MLYSKIIHNNKLYILLHAEQVYQNFNSFDCNLGFFNYYLTNETLNRVVNEIKKINDVNSIVIDCYSLEDTHNIYDTLIEIMQYCNDKTIALSFIRISESLYGKSKIHSLVGDFDLQETRAYKINGNNLNHYDVYSGEKENTDNFDDFIFDLFGNTILKEKIINTYCIPHNPPYSESSNVELPKYIDLKKFIEEKEISFLGIYLLCKKEIIPDLEKRKQEDKKPPILFFNSMAGSYLASLFARIALLDVAFLDHLGPKKKIYRRMHKDILKTDQEYLIIADVVCLGAEIERAKGIIEHEGGTTQKVLSIVFIKVTDKSSESNVCSLFTLTKDNNAGIDYQIITNFPEIKKEENE